MRNVSIAIVLLIRITLSAQDTRVLFIGNSYTYSNDLPGMFMQLAASQGEAVETGMVAPGGFTFAQHTQHQPTLDALALGNWDFVVLQEQSQLPSFPPAQVETECFPFATQLAALARASNACTEVVFLMTWGRENGDAANCPLYPPVCTYEGMQQRLHDSYVQMALTNDAFCAPVGMVWWTYRSYQPNVSLYTDGSHPNTLGSYVAATTLFNTIFRRTALGPEIYAPMPLSADQVFLTNTLATQVTLDTSATWNIGINDPVAQASFTDLGGGLFQFADQSPGATSWSWDFGDGSTSTDADPLHSYSSEGTYTVTLEVTDPCLRTDSLTFTIAFISSGIADLVARALVQVDASTSPPTLHIGAITVPGSVEVRDALGRSIAQAKLLPGTPLRLQLPHGPSGILAWRLLQQDLPTQRGKLLIP